MHNTAVNYKMQGYRYIQWYMADFRKNDKKRSSFNTVIYYVVQMQDDDLQYQLQ